MKLNRIQIMIFKKLGREKGLDADAYVQNHAVEYIGEQRDRLQDLSEEEGDRWINKAYLASLSPDSP
jgi:hypothetical protein